MCLDGVCGDEQRLGEVAVGVAAGASSVNRRSLGVNASGPDGAMCGGPGAASAKFSLRTFDEWRSTAGLSQLDATAQMLVRLPVPSRATQCSAGIDRMSARYAAMTGAPIRWDVVVTAHRASRRFASASARAPRANQGTSRKHFAGVNANTEPRRCATAIHASSKGITSSRSAAIKTKQPYTIKKFACPIRLPVAQSAPSQFDRGIWASSDEQIVESDRHIKHVAAQTRLVSERPDRSAVTLATPKAC